jgi:antitoxin component YwqK of YwqJK toxin-antitoxin module
MNSRFLTGLSICILFSCNQYKKPPKYEGDQINGVYIERHNNDTIRQLLHFKDGKLHGVAKEFYNTGQLFLEAFYNNGVKDGITKKYYQTGILHEETPYVDGDFHGIVRGYHKSGKLAYEMPYENGKPLIGLKEYGVDGTLKTVYPEIEYKIHNTVLLDYKYRIDLSLTDNYKKVDFYVGYLNDDKYLGNQVEKLTTENGKAKILYEVFPGDVLFKELNIIAKITTVQGNVYLQQRTINIAAENL